jgi:hypothetical protein
MITGFLKLCNCYLDKYLVILHHHSQSYSFLTSDNMHSPFSVLSILTTVSTVIAQAAGVSG